MNGRLSGKVALITGAASGLGAASARLFVNEGANVVIADVLEEQGGALAEEIGADALFVPCDVTDEASVNAAFEQAVAQFGKLDVVFANAGGGGIPAPIAQMDVNGWDTAMALMARGPMLCMKRALPHLRAAGGGAIVVTASIAGMRPGISHVAYSVAKAAVVHLVEQAAVEFGPDRIRVNAISPGIIPTPGVGGFFGVARDRVDAMLGAVSEIFADAQPLPRAGEPDDIARTALFLASDDAGWVTGQNFVVDGGMMAMGPASLDPTRADGILQRTAALAARYQS